MWRNAAGFRAFWLSRSVSLVGDGVAMTALLLLVSRRDGPTGVAVLLLAESVPRFFGPLAGALADRLPARRLLIAAELAQAVVLSAVVLVMPGTVVLALLVAVAAAASTVVAAAGRAVLPRLVPEADLLRANGWLGVSFTLQAVLGPVLGGLLVAGTSTRTALAVDAASFVVAAVLLLGLPALRPVRAPEEMPGLFADVRDGLGVAARTPVVRAIAVLLLAGVFFGSLDNVALVFLAEDELNAGATGFGLLGGALGLAMLAGSGWLARAGRRPPAPALLLGGWAATGVGLAATGLSPTLPAAMAAQAVTGLGNGVANVAEETVLQTYVPAELLGRVGGVLSSAAFVGSAAAYAIGGLLATQLSPRSVFLVAGTGLLVVTLMCAPALRAAARVPMPIREEPV